MRRQAVAVSRVGLRAETEIMEAVGPAISESRTLSSNSPARIGGAAAPRMPARAPSPEADFLSARMESMLA
jgi:hypothetical protein